MNLSEIETFLTIVNTKSITKTAELLFLSQPAVSHRLSALETELGFDLIIRKKGHKQVELTAKGADFVSVAERWMSLWKETQALRLSHERMPLTIGCTDSMNIALFAPLYRKIVDSGLKIDLRVKTHQSCELYSLLNNHDIDIGFVYHQLHYNNVITEKLFEEKMYLIQTDPPGIKKPLIHTDELNSATELFLSWDDNFQIWHERWFPDGIRPHFRADTITLLNSMWTHPENWMVAPASVVAWLASSRPLYISELKNPPPSRLCYRILHRFPRLISEQAVALFGDFMETYIRENKPEIPIGIPFFVQS